MLLHKYSVVTQAYCCYTSIVLLHKHSVVTIHKKCISDSAFGIMALQLGNALLADTHVSRTLTSL